MTVNISFIKLKGNVTDNYELTKTGWKNKDVHWKNIHKVMYNSTIQYAPYTWRNGYKTYPNWNNQDQDCIILDIDDGLSIPEFQKRYSYLTYCLATTKSHQKLKKGLIHDRYRICIPCINVSHDAELYFRALELFCEDNDKQTLTKTSSFLGNNGAIIIYNDGEPLDFYVYNELAKEQLDSERIEKLVIDEDYLPSYRSSLSLNAIKEQLTFEVVVDILTELGYEVKGNKFKLRDDERTDSATINYRSLIITDFGDGYFGDILDVLTSKHDYSFNEAMKYVSNYL